MKKQHIFIVFLACLLTLLTASTHVFAGGSSYSVNYFGKNSVARPGAAVFDSQKIFFQTYFDETYWDIYRIQIDTINVQCWGDDVIKTANVRVGSKTYGSADFQKVGGYDQLYRAKIKPLLFILANNSFYRASVDLVPRDGLKVPQIATCEVDEIVFFNPDESNTAYPMEAFSYIDKKSPSVIVVGDTRRYASPALSTDTIIESPYADIKAEKSGFMRGTINKKPAGGYQFLNEYQNWDDNAFYNVMLMYFNASSVKFDITSPRFFPAGKLDTFDTYEIQEMHLYKKLSSNGSVGSIAMVI